MLIAFTNIVYSYICQMSIDNLTIFRFVYLYNKGGDNLANIDKIKSLAKSKGIKLSFICEQLGLTRTYLADVKNGKTSISDERLKVIADILETTPEYLKDETELKEKVTADDEIDINDFQFALSRATDDETELTEAEIQDVKNYIKYVKDKHKKGK